MDLESRSRGSSHGSSVAVAIPCYNEAAAIRRVVEQWRTALPEAEVVVFDNRSSDDTAREARSAGARVDTVPLQGKGHVVQAIFQILKDRPAVVMVDGDGTYPPEFVRPLLDPVLAGEYDMAVGRRVSAPALHSGFIARLRLLGNRGLRLAFRFCLGAPPGDLLSGYRVFSPRMLNEVRPRSTGFEIETELTGEAVARGYRVLEVEVPYYTRIEGTQSKLRILHDGLRILRTIAALGLRLRPMRLAALLLVLLALAGLVLWLAARVLPR